MLELFVALVLPFKATLHAPTHTPRVNKPWPISIRVTDRSGHPIRARLTMRFLFAGIPVGNAPSILDKDYTITAEITVPKGGAEGMIVTLGGRFGGYGMFLQKGKPVFAYNLLDLQRTRWEGGIGGKIGADLFARALEPELRKAVFAPLAAIDAARERIAAARATTASYPARGSGGSETSGSSAAS